MTDVLYHPLIDRDTAGLDKSPLFCSPDREKVAGTAREGLMETCQMLLDEYLNTESLDAESAALEPEMEFVSELTRKLIAENATTAMQQEECNRRYDELVQRYRDAEDRAQQLQSQKVTRRFQADVIESFMNEIRAFDDSLPVQYSDRLWLNLIDRVAVYEDGRLVF